MHATDWHLGLSGFYALSYIQGFQQTPKGGQVGSTSPRRPNYKNLHIRTNSDTQLGATFGYNALQLELDYFPIHLDGEMILPSDLITHDIPLSAGRYFSAHVNDELYSLRMSYIHTMCSRWQLQPKANIHWLSHDYHFQSGSLSSSRVFAASGISVGLQSDYQLTHHWLLSTNVDLAIPVTNLDVYQAKLAVGYQSFHNHFTLTPTFSVAWHEVRFKDKQTIPNFLKYTAFPTVALGIIINWKN